LNKKTHESVVQSSREKNTFYLYLLIHLFRIDELLLLLIIKVIIQMRKSEAIVFYCLFVITLGIQAHFETVAIIGTNDIHGVAFPVRIKNTFTNETYESGGIQYMAQMIETIKDEYKGNALYFDAGDQFKGGF
jgi:2',3'-cyclic-nucleotide 2'-phosphodiesterase (5'-nucleotidase family)